MCRAAWDGNETWRDIIVMTWVEGDRRLLVAVNYAPRWGQCYVATDFPALSGGDIAIQAMPLIRAVHPGATLHIVGVNEGPAGEGVEYAGLLSSAEKMKELFLQSDLVVAPARCPKASRATTEGEAGRRTEVPHGRNPLCVGRNPQGFHRNLAAGCGGTPAGSALRATDSLRRLG